MNWKDSKRKGSRFCVLGTFGQVVTYQKDIKMNGV